MSKSRIHLILVVTLLLVCAGSSLAQTVASKSDEPKLIAVVKDSSAPLKARVDACRQLAIVGGKDSIAPLAALLGDEQLSHMARYALQPNPDPAVDEALRDALGTVKGRPLVGVIHTVGYRRDAKAVGALGALANSGNTVVASAAMRALGSIGNPAAVQALRQALPKAPAECKLDCCEGLLRCAESLAADGRRQDAIAIYDQLYKTDAPHQVRGGALRAAIVTRQGADRQKMLKEHLGDEDYILFSAAVQASQEIRTAQATTTLVDAMKSLPADRQILVIQSLGLRGDQDAAPAVLDAAKSGDARVRVAAIQAVTELGDAAAVPVMVQLLDDGDREVAKAAQDSLATFPDQEADGAVMRMFAGDDAAKQRLALDLMGRRRMTGSIPTLLGAARDADSKVRADAIKLIGDLGGPDQLPAMLDLLANAKAPQDLAAIEQALTAICLKATDSKAEADKLIAPLDKAQSAQKVVLLRVLGAVGGPGALKAVAACAKSDNADVRSAAIRELSTWKTVDAAPLLLAMARETSNPSEKTLFLRGYLGLAVRGNMPPEDRLAMCRQAAGLVVRDDEKRLLLGTLSNIESPGSVDLIAPYMDDASCRQEAALAMVTVSEKLLRGEGPAPFAAKLLGPLEKAAQAFTDNDLAKRAGAVLARAKSKAGVN